jgi:hypothetical protein
LVEGFRDLHRDMIAEMALARQPECRTGGELITGHMEPAQHGNDPVTSIAQR